MNYILFDGDRRSELLPFTFTRPVADIRIGILTIREKWEKYLGIKTSSITEKYLKNKFKTTETDSNILINASFCPTLNLVEKVKNLSKNEAIFKDNCLIAFYKSDANLDLNYKDYKKINFDEDIIQIKNTWDIFSLNYRAVSEDFALLTEGRKSQPIPKGVKALNKKDIFIEKSAKLTFAILNASSGPIYIGKESEIMEGSIVRGPFAMCEHSVLKLGAKIYGGTTLGPYCKVGGEVNNSVFFGFSNKGHDGFLGNSVLGEWCNLGADTNTSNLKNNYADVKLWNYNSNKFSKTGLQFCGLIMGDHSKCGINTMFNTGTVVGVCANIFGSGFPRNFIPSFRWGGASGFSEYKIDKVFEVVSKVMERRNIIFNEQDKEILTATFEKTTKYRNNY